MTRPMPGGFRLNRDERLVVAVKALDACGAARWDWARVRSGED